MVRFMLKDRSNQQLLIGVKHLVGREREATAQLVAHLAEIDARELYLQEGCSSLFKYCTEVLHLSEWAAYHRIEVARVARRFPVILEKLAEAGAEGGAGAVEAGGLDILGGGEAGACGGGGKAGEEGERQGEVARHRGSLFEKTIGFG